MFLRFPPVNFMCRVFVSAIGFLLVCAVFLGADGTGEKAVVELCSCEPLSEVSVRTVQVPLTVSSEVDIAGVQFSLKFDDESMVPGEPKLTDRSAHMSVAHNSRDGEMIVLLYSTDGKGISPGDGPVVTLSFTISDGAERTGEIRLEDIILADPEARAVPAIVRHTTVSIESSLPTRYSLAQNHPNPFNPETDISYQIPDSFSPLRTTLRVYNVLGQEVRTLVNEVVEPGFYLVTWDGKDDFGSEVSSGVYFYRLVTGHYTETKRMLLLK